LLGVRVGGVGADLLGGAEFDETAVVEDGDAVAEVADERHGVGDEEVGETMLALEVAEEVDDLCADGDVESAHGLVEHEELWLEGKSACDIDALALAAGELVRVTVEGGGIEADGGEEFEEAGGGERLAVDGEGLGEDLADAHAWVECGVGVLKDDLYLSAKRTQPTWAGDEEIFFAEVDCPGGGLDKAQEHAGDGALAGAGFADESESFAGLDVEGDVVDDAGDASIGGVVLDEVAGAKERRNMRQRGRLHRRMVAGDGSG
jgi:hypothetical protein